MVNEMSVFEAAGGAETFKILVERFYARVASDPILRRIYPEEDLSSATERLTLFLIQYWGCLLYTSPSPRDISTSRMPSSA